MTKVWGIKVYTKTTFEKSNGKYISKMLGVIEAPVTKMIKQKEIYDLAQEVKNDN